MLNEKFMREMVGKLGYFNEYVGDSSQLAMLENGFLLDNYFSFIVEEAMENALKKELENLGFSISYLHCFTKRDMISYYSFEEKIAFATIEKEGREEELLVKFLVSHEKKTIRRLHCYNVYAKQALVEQFALFFKELVYKQKRLRYLVEHYQVISQVEED